MSFSANKDDICYYTFVSLTFTKHSIGVCLVIRLVCGVVIMWNVKCIQTTELMRTVWFSAGYSAFYFVLSHLRIWQFSWYLEASCSEIPVIALVAMWCVRCNTAVRVVRENILHAHDGVSPPHPRRAGALRAAARSWNVYYVVLPVCDVIAAWRDARLMLDCVWWAKCW